MQLTPQQDRERMMGLLHITAPLRNGADGRNTQAPNYANYDESKANPYPTLPDPLMLKNGKRVTNAETWWKQRRPEIVEDFDREIYGRLPQDIPNVRWDVISITGQKNGDVPVITKQLVGTCRQFFLPASQRGNSDDVDYSSGCRSSRAGDDGIRFHWPPSSGSASAWCATGSDGTHLATTSSCERDGAMRSCRPAAYKPTTAQV